MSALDKFRFTVDDLVSPPRGRCCGEFHQAVTATRINYECSKPAKNYKISVISRSPVPESRRLTNHGSRRPQYELHIRGAEAS